MKKALITGITGQDGSYLAEFLLEKGYEVHGLKRRSSSFNTGRINHLYQDPHEDKRNFILHYGDLTDSTSLIRLIKEIQPDEIYNLGAQSHVQVSFEVPEYTSDADGFGTLRLLEAILILDISKKVRFYQASTPELCQTVQKSKPDRRSVSIRLRLLNCLAKLRRFRRKRRLRFILAVLTVWQNYMLSGWLEPIAKPTICSAAMGSFLTTKARVGEKHSSRGRLQWRPPEYDMIFKRSYISAI